MGEVGVGPEMGATVVKEAVPSVDLAQKIIRESEIGNWRGALEVASDESKRPGPGILEGTRVQERLARIEDSKIDRPVEEKETVDRSWKNKDDREALLRSLESPYREALSQRLDAYRLDKLSRIGQATTNGTASETTHVAPETQKITAEEGAEEEIAKILAASPEAQGPNIRIGSATWRNENSDQPVNVTGYAGKGSDGRDYVTIEGSSTAIPLDEVEYPKDATNPPGGEPQVNPDNNPPEAEKKTEVSKQTETEKIKIREKAVQMVKEHMDKELEDKRNKATNGNEQAMFDALRERWKGADPKKIEGDFKTMMENNPEQLMKELLRDRVIYGKRIFTDAEIDTILADKSEGSFYKKMEPEVVSQVIRRKILEGGLTSEDIAAIEKTPWGRNTIEQALEKNEKARQHIEELIVKQEGKKTWKNLKEFKETFWKQAKKNWWLLVIAVFIPVIGWPSVAAGLSALYIKEKVLPNFPKVPTVSEEEHH